MSPTAKRTSSRAEQPWLLPANRKLRNLLSISLRNLSLLAESPARTTGKTADDDALPHTLRSPAKLVALGEQKALGHSRSSTDLRAVAEHIIAAPDDAEGIFGGNDSLEAAKKASRPNGTATANVTVTTMAKLPSFRRLRRQSTLEWVNDTPQRRQERLENIIRERMSDVFLSLHVPGIEEPVYISETVHQTMNPSFRRIDWGPCSTGVVRTGTLILRVWIKPCKTDSWRHLLQQKLALADLQYLGKNLETLDCVLPENIVIYHLADGVYTSPTASLPTFAIGRLSATSIVSSGTKKVLTSSFDALLRLSKLDDSIQDALATRDQFARDLENLLQSNEEALAQRDAVAEAEDRLKTVEFAKLTVEKQLQKARRQQDEKRLSLATRREIMKSEAASQIYQMRMMQETRSHFFDMREEHKIKQKSIQNQRRRICEEMQKCYPIQQCPGKLLAFSIRGLHMPNSEDLDSEPPEMVAAALGYVAHVLQLIGFYLGHPLSYPVNPRGSTSTVYDAISILKTNSTVTSDTAERTLRTYPLFTKSVPRFRSEYAVFLLNENIRILLESVFSLRVLDIRQTLPNLKYLLYVATSGEGELPARKAGGIRGLIRPQNMRRMGSADSGSSGLSGMTLLSNGKPKGAAQKLRAISGKAS